MDDTYSILKKGEENVFLSHLNSVRPSIQFTFEKEKNGSLPFLNCEVTRRENGSLSTKRISEAHQ